MRKSVVLHLLLWLHHAVAFLSLSSFRRPSILHATPPPPAVVQEPPVVLHHTALQTSNITRALDFYSLLGFTCVERFRAGPARAAWLQQHSSSNATTTPCYYLELIEVPGYLLQQQQRAQDPFRTPSFLGYHHVALQVYDPLDEFVATLNQTSFARFGKYLRVATQHYNRQQRIGMAGIFEMAFLYDADGCLVELIHKISNVETPIDSGWEPWDGTGFVTKKKFSSDGGM